MNSISRNSIKILIGIQLFATIFHIFIILKIVPYNITWGGRLNNDYEMYIFETISISISAFFSYILLVKANIIKSKFSDKIITTILYVYFGIFVLNTIGIFFAKTTLESFIGGILTAISAILIWFILKNKKTHENQY